MRESHTVITRRGRAADVKLAAARENLRRVALVGLTESWPATVALVRFALDKDRAAPAMWDKALGVERNAAKTKALFSGRDVLRALKPEVWRSAKLYLSAETELYADAIIAHADACVRLLAASSECPFRTSFAFAARLNASLLAPDLLPARAFRDTRAVFSYDDKRRHRDDRHTS